MSEVSGSELNALLAHVAAVERVMQSAAVQPLLGEYGRTQVVDAARATLDALRRDLQDAAVNAGGAAARASVRSAASCDETQIAAQAGRVLAARAQTCLHTVFNLTGTVLHTNLGRALLPDEAVRAVVEALTRPANLEFNLVMGSRGDRDDLIDELICELTGAEAATVVNNNAAVVLLTLSALALKKEVIVSRGELVEIGGAFRIPDIMSRAGARLREVGTTNRTQSSARTGTLPPGDPGRGGVNRVYRPILGACAVHHD